LRNEEFPDITLAIYNILVDQQLGGNWVGEVDTNDLPVNMIIDYVQVYQ